MAMSHTAPRVELQELEDEIQGLDDTVKEQLRRDLYGQDATIVEETPELLRTSIAQLQEALEATDDDDKQAFLRAQQECPEYVNSETFLLPFLRCEQFNATLAARRIVRYWEEKLNLFGDEHAFGPVTLDSLQESDFRVIRGGGVSLVPSKDEGGRALIHFDRGLTFVRLNGRDAVLRCFLYLAHVIIEDDVAVQQRGLIAVSASRSPFKMEHFDRMGAKRIYQMSQFLPIRLVAYHLVVSFVSMLSFTKLVLPYALWLMGPDLRSRLVQHNYTSDEDMMQRFAAYGITELPFAAGGTFRFDGEAWLRERRRIERLNLMVTRVEEER